ncbi:MAG: PEP-CTERM/exosortase system-associated acyltransferase [Candidatus Omnitrophota bacterium]
MHKQIIGKTEFIFGKADAKDSLDDIYRLRFQVYCRECGFFDESDYPNGLETDRFDPYSLHFLARDAEGIIGTARLIIKNPHGFPFMNHSKGPINYDMNTLDMGKIAEVSRLAISKAYRRRRDDGLYYSSDYKDPLVESTRDKMKRIMPMAFGLYREMYQECKRRRITHWFALMEKGLWLLLRMHHFVFDPIGEEIDCCGPVRPYICDIHKMEEIVSRKSPQFLSYFLDGLDREYQPDLAIVDKINIDNAKRRTNPF